MLTNVDKHNILNSVVDARVSYIGNTPAFQAGKVGSIPTTRSIFKVLETSSTRKWEMSTRAYIA